MPSAGGATAAAGPAKPTPIAVAKKGAISREVVRTASSIAMRSSAQGATSVIRRGVQ
ncbi:Uncharacterised protein [Mycobacteroides abscessus subsp. abscessus]|nr:Uncharacterised protein [Mycobacteroides abscessus subsp. abscessus]